MLGSSGAELELGRAFMAYADFEEKIGRHETAEDLRDRAFSIRRDAGLQSPEREIVATGEAVLQ
jgi:hypothetical protein